MKKQGIGKGSRESAAGGAAIKRVYVEKKPGFDIEARQLKGDIAAFLGGRYPALAHLAGLRILNRYDVARLDEAQFRRAVDLVLSEPPCDRVYGEAALPAAALPVEGSRVFAVEYLPGQYDQRSDSAEQCIEMAVGLKPLVRTARVYRLEAAAGFPVDDAALEAVKRYLINPVDSREAAAAVPGSLESPETAAPGVPVVAGFHEAGAAALEALLREYGLAMSAEDLSLCQSHFRAEGRDPSLAELRVLDTYWSDHCRHTSFNTVLNEIRIEGNGREADALRAALAGYEAARREVYGDRAGDHPPSLMDMATLGVRLLKKRGLVPDLDESPEINACTIKVDVRFDDGSDEPWLLLFKNETHNHPTEIEPFGGAATCLGGAIRDPLSGRAYVHQAMRVSGGGDPRQSLAETLPGKLPQVKIAREAAAGYASYGNQIGLNTGQVEEFYHPGFIAKRMELGAVIGAVPAAWVRREEPGPGDLVILVGGKTGRDGIGGATGSSKAHTGESVEKSGAEVQKGNAVEERKLQRLFRKPGLTGLIKRCNDFGAGGVSVAAGELAAGLDINLDALPKKYAGLDGIELAISESQERMAVVVAAADAGAFIAQAAAENLDAVVIAQVTATVADGGARLRMNWRGRTIVDLSRNFLDTNGASRSAAAKIMAVPCTVPAAAIDPAGTFASAAPGLLMDALEQELASLRSGSRRGLKERFDGSIGAASVLFPWGGSGQGTPECGMAALLRAPPGGADKESRTASLMSFGYNPELASLSPYAAAKGAIREALAKFACLGGDYRKARLSLQEYFERAESPVSWGKPVAALLGALEAQLALGLPAIGGKDSMSGSYRDAAHGIDIDVPPTLVAFAAGTAPAAQLRSGALSGRAGNLILLLSQSAPEQNEWERFKANMAALADLSGRGLVRAAYPVGSGGVAPSLAVMAFGNMTGVELRAGALVKAMADLPVDGAGYQGSVLLEIAADDVSPPDLPGIILGRTLAGPAFRIVTAAGASGAEASLDLLRRAYECPLAQVYPQTAGNAAVAEFPEPAPLPAFVAEYRQSGEAGLPRRVQEVHTPWPLVTLPVFPGTNGEWDMERAFRRAGARIRTVIFRNRSREDILEATAELAAAIHSSQILAFSGGFSAGDEPDGSGKFIANVLRSPPVADAVMDLLENRDGLVLGICNGFQALIKLGLVPYGAYRGPGLIESAPTLTQNRLGRHISRMVRTRVMSNRSPWLALEEPGTVHILPVSHGEGRLIMTENQAASCFKAGQAACCYVDATGRPSLAEPDNPNGSAFAIEALTSPDGRVLGKMAHSERCGEYVHVNIPGNKFQRLFEGGVGYFR